MAMNPGNPTTPAATGALPRVSVIVRSMGRPELRGALEALARQDHPALEIVVVDATGGGHPPLPEVAWRPGHELRIVGGAQRLTRPMAANAGLRAARGDWLMFLDDDDDCDPGHVSTYVAATARHPDAMLLYGTSRFLGPDGHLLYEWGMPFNPALLQIHPLFCWQAAIFRRRVIDLGCAFDETLEVCEDRDFVMQVAVHSEPIQIDAVTFNFRPDLGTSGTGRGGNWNPVRMLQFEQRLRAKWAGACVVQSELAQVIYENALRRRDAGDRAGAKAALEAMLATYREDPRALHSLAQLALDDGDLASAERYAEQAVSVARDSDEYRTTLAKIKRLRPQPNAAGRAVGRNEPCPCGSGLRYKNCHGAAAAPPRVVDSPFANAAPSPSVPATPGAIDLAIARGDIGAAMRLVDTITAEANPARGDAVAAGRVALAMGASARAMPMLERTLARHDDLEVRQVYRAGLEREWADATAQACRREATTLLDRLNSRAPHAGAPGARIVIVGDLREGRRERDTARGVVEALGAEADVRLLSLRPAGNADFGAIQTLDPADGASIDADQALWLAADESFAPWLGRLRARRLVLQLPADSPEAALRRLVWIDRDAVAGEVIVTVPGESARRYACPFVRMEYPWITPAEAPSAAAVKTSGELSIGRLGAAAATEHALTDPALYRELLARGFRVRLHGGNRVAGLFADLSAAPRFDLVPEAAESPARFLAGLDIYLQSRGPIAEHEGDAKLLTAMGAGCAIVVFKSALEAAEIIAPGHNGLVVASNDEALASVERLASDPELRRRLGTAARASVLALMAAQRKRACEFYLGAPDAAGLAGTPAPAVTPAS